MNKKTLEALHGSIKKWEIIVGGGEEIDCPLCKLFCPGCTKCPVMRKSSEDMCSNTPYDEWTSHMIEKHPKKFNRSDMKPQCPECIKIAKKELNFLKSLLPKGVGK